MESRVVNQATPKLNAGLRERSRRCLLKGSFRMHSRRWSARDCPLGLARAKPMDVDFERCGDSRESVQGRDGIPRRQKSTSSWVTLSHFAAFAELVPAC